MDTKGSKHYQRYGGDYGWVVYGIGVDMVIYVCYWRERHSVDEINNSKHCIYQRELREIGLC